MNSKPRRSQTICCTVFVKRKGPIFDNMKCMNCEIRFKDHPASELMNEEEIEEKEQGMDKKQVADMKTIIFQSGSLGIKFEKAQVIEVEEGSQAAEKGITKGWYIVSVNEKILVSAKNVDKDIDKEIGKNKSSTTIMFATDKNDYTSYIQTHAPGKKKRRKKKSRRAGRNKINPQLSHVMNTYSIAIHRDDRQKKEKNFNKEQDAFKARALANQKESQKELNRKAMEKANQTGLELFKTEKTYVSILKTISFVFIRRLTLLNEMEEEMNYYSPLMSSEDIITIFQNIEQLHDMHDKLFTDFEDLRNCGAGNGDLVNKLGKTFMNYMPYFKAYTKYVNNYEKGVELLRVLRKKNPKLEEWITFNEKVLCENRGENLNLESLMITPVQRIPRYLLLLKEIIAQGQKSNAAKKLFTPEYTREKEGAGGLELEQAYNKLLGVAKLINDSFRLNEARQRVFDLDQRFKGLDKFKDCIQDKSEKKKGKTSIVHQSRYFVMEGYIQKKSKNRMALNPWHDRLLILCNDLLIYCSKPSNEDKGNIEVRNVLPLQVVKIKEVATEKKKDEGWFNFQISSDKDDELLFRTNESDKRELWIEKIKEYCKKTQDIQDRRNNMDGSRHNSCADYDSTLFTSVNQSSTGSNLITEPILEIHENSENALPHLTNDDSHVGENSTIHDNTKIPNNLSSADLQINVEEEKEKEARNKEKQKLNKEKQKVVNKESKKKSKPKKPKNTDRISPSSPKAKKSKNATPKNRSQLSPRSGRSAAKSKGSTPRSKSPAAGKKLALNRASSGKKATKTKNNIKSPKSPKRSLKKKKPDTKKV